jgi:hypothetical protein
MRQLHSILIGGALVLSAIGCSREPAGPAIVHGMNVNGYEIEYELAPSSSILADATSLTISAGKTTIRIADSKLNVDGKAFGTVKASDRITAVGGKVTVNGEERKPE